LFPRTEQSHFLRGANRVLLVQIRSIFLKGAMSGRELIHSTFGLEETGRIPWVPFVGVHAAHLLGVDASRFLCSEDLLVSGVGKAIELYRPDGIPVVFDLQLEAEALGCRLNWSDNTPPAVTDHPLADGAQIGDLAFPASDHPRIASVMRAAARLRRSHDGVALYGLLTGPFTLGLHLLGTDIFIRMLESPAEVHGLLDFCTDVAIRMADLYAESGCDVIAVVDPMTSQIDPASFIQFVSPQVTRIFNQIRSNGLKSSFFVCGYAQQNVEAMCACRPDNISIDENIPLDYARDVALGKGLSFGGNMRLTTVLLMGTEEDAQQEALDCMDLGGSKGFVLSPGCDLPMRTPVKNLQAVTALVQDEYRQRVVRALERKERDLCLLNMADYGQADKVIVDIITLNSESCAPCQYMVEAVKRVAPHFEGIVEWREHPIVQFEAVSFMSSLMVKNIPTICIDGKIAFVSKIPPQQELIAAIQRRINEKLRLRIRSNKGEILIFGRDEAECGPLRSRVEQALQELGAEIDVRTSHDSAEWSLYGIAQTPALVVARYRLKSQGSLPSEEVIKEWIKEL
jgi:MtaA/CmuA family methyltransferase